MHRGSEIPRSIRPPTGAPQTNWPQKQLYRKAGYVSAGDIEDSRLAVVLATFYKMAWKWPIWLQAKMMKATLAGLPQGLSFGCALGTIVGVEAGYSHTVADMTCTQVDLGMLGTVAGTVTCVCDLGRPEVAAACSFAAMVGGNMDCVRDITCRMIDQDHFEQAVACSYETVLLGARSGQPQLIATSTVNVGRAGQRYVEMLAEVVARLVKNGHGRPAAKVCLLVISQGYLGIALKISGTMMKRGHLKEPARVSSYLVAAGHNDFKRCLDGESDCKESGPHPSVCKMARRWTRLLSLTAFVGGVVALHYFPKHRAEISETGRRKKRQVAHHFNNAKRCIGSHAIQASDSDSEDELSSPSSSSQTAAELSSQHNSSPDLNQGHDKGIMQRGQSKGAHPSRKGRQHSKQQQLYSSDEDDDW